MKIIRDVCMACRNSCEDLKPKPYGLFKFKTEGVPCVWLCRRFAGLKNGTLFIMNGDPVPDGCLCTAEHAVSQPC